MTLTPLENTILNSYQLAAGLAAANHVKDLLQKGRDAERGVLDRTLPIGVRSQAAKDARHVNDTLAMAATIQETAGISA